MTDPSSAGFAKFIPGFDFLQNLASGAGQGSTPMPGLAGWVAPTLNVEDIDKRISELRAVQFWLEQNAKALAATVQALEVQKLTLDTLKGMNLNMAEMAKAFQPKPAAPAQASAAAKTSTAMTDPLQLWAALTQQFQHIAATAMKEAASTATAATGTGPGAKKTGRSPAKARPGSAKATAKTTTKKTPQARP
jgi:hypothetical protein